MRHLLLACRCGRAWAEHVKSKPRAICPACGDVGKILSIPLAFVLKRKPNAKKSKRRKTK
jgi:hypothetical protein